MPLSFLKMHGAGNDFVVLDARSAALHLSAKQMIDIANRRTGVGCDQLVIMEPSQHANAFMRIYNADGSESGACGNATRCVAWLLMRETHQSSATLETTSGVLTCAAAGDRLVTVDMGVPKCDWQDIPLAEAQDTLHVALEDDGIADPVAVNMGNPHIVFFVKDVAAIPLHDIGPRLERHPLFPKRVNVSIAQILSPDRIKLRVWERGAGETLACGTAACATLVAACRRGLTGMHADVLLPGGTLTITWNHSVQMTGPVALSFEGVLTVDAMR